MHPPALGVLREQGGSTRCGGGPIVAAVRRPPELLVSSGGPAREREVVASVSIRPPARRLRYRRQGATRRGGDGTARSIPRSHGTDSGSGVQWLLARCITAHAARTHARRHARARDLEQRQPSPPRLSRQRDMCVCVSVERYLARMDGHMMYGGLTIADVYGVLIPTAMPTPCCRRRLAMPVGQWLV
jgi:hypothetical protein